MKYALLPAFIVLSFVTFYPVLGVPYLGDDYCIVGPQIKMNLRDLWLQSGPFHENYPDFYRPLSPSTFLLESQLGPFSERTSRSASILLHGVNSFLVALLCRRLLTHFHPDARENMVISLSAGILFLVYASHSETVTWISARPDLLATFFCLLSLLLALQNTPKGLILSLLCAPAAFFAKESSFALPLLVTAILVAVAIQRKERFSRAKIVYCLSLFALLGIFLVVRASLAGSLFSKYGHQNISPISLLKAFETQLLRSFLPPLPYQIEALARPILVSAVVLVALTGLFVGALLIRLMIRGKGYGFSALMLLLVGCVVLSLVPAANIGMSLFSTNGERIVYLPSVFSCILLTTIVAGIGRETSSRVLLFVALLSLNAYMLNRSHSTWKAAGDLFAKINQQIVSFSNDGNVTIVNLPDNYKGAFLFRGYSCIMPIYGIRGVLSTQNLRLLEPEQILTRRNGEYELTLARRTTFIKISRAAECLETVQSTSQKLRFVNHCSDDDVLFFNGAQMQKLDAIPVIEDESASQK